jgi:hypothetical protein
MKALKFLFTLYFVFVGADSQANENDSLACMKRYLNSSGENLDSWCTGKMQTIMNNHENRVLKELSEPTGQCVLNGLKSNTFFDDLVRKHVLHASTDMNEEEHQKKFDDLKTKMKATYEQAASECDHTPNYDGFFGHLLNVHGDSLKSLTERHCTFTYVNNTKLINLHDIDSNPKQIDTSDIDCNGVIQSLKSKREKELKEEMVANSVSQDAIDCIIREDKAANIFDVALSMIVNDRAPLCVIHKKSNIRTLIDKLSAFAVSSAACLEVKN